MSLSSNARKIDRAFSRLKASEAKIVRDGMIRLAKRGIEYLVDAHERHAQDMRHTTERDTLAWAVSHNGDVIASGSHYGDGSDIGNAKYMAESILSSTKGWVAVILSEMYGYYRADYEQDFLYETAFNTQAEFQTYFKKIR